MRLLSLLLLLQCSPAEVIAVIEVIAALDELALQLTPSPPPHHLPGRRTLGRVFPLGDHLPGRLDQGQQLPVVKASSSSRRTLRNAYVQMMQIRDWRGYNYWAGMHGNPQN